jgi:hypothetical protein
VILEMHAAGDLGATAYAEGLAMADQLIAAQAPDGSWGDGDYQATAYALLGLRADPWNFTLPWQQAIIRGADFLEASASPAPSCGWVYPPDPPANECAGVECGEANSEILSALAAINTLPFVDGFETGDANAWTSAEAGAPFAPRTVPAAAARPVAAPLR